MKAYIKHQKEQELGSIELIVLGLLAALIIVVAIPALTGLGTQVSDTINYVNGELEAATNSSGVN